MLSGFKSAYILPLELISEIAEAISVNTVDISLIEMVVFIPIYKVNSIQPFRNHIYLFLLFHRTFSWLLNHKP